MLKYNWDSKWHCSTVQHLVRISFGKREFASNIGAIFCIGQDVAL